MEENLEGQLDIWQSVELMSKEKNIDVKCNLSEENNDIDYRKITIGSIVETVLNGERVVGKVVNEYGPGNCSLSFIYDNDKKHTAINRYSVTKVLS